MVPAAYPPTYPPSYPFLWQSEFDKADAACKDLSEYMVEDSLKEEPETFLGLVHAFLVSFDQADRFNQDRIRADRSYLLHTRIGVS